MATNAPASSSADGNSPDSNILSKDEVGWYFVESYYTTLSKSPEKLHLFYGKGSQFVQGPEAEVTPVSVGRPAIQERIKQLDFQDCKVRITNVDSQASFGNIVIQVIGESSNKSAEPKRFVQTFVLAQQPSGYFVLNDILRYMAEDSDDEESAGAADNEATDEAEAVTEAAAPVEAEPSKSVEEAKEEVAQLDPAVVDQKLEEVSSTKEIVTPNGGTVESPVVKMPEMVKDETPVADPESAAKELAEEDAKAPEKPKDPSPTPVSKTSAPTAPPPAAAAPAPAPPAVVEPAAPAKPMTWASRIAAASSKPKPVVPLAKTPTPPAPAQSRAPAPAAPTSQPAAPAAAAAAAPAAEDPANAGWQTAGADSKRQNRPQSISGPLAEKEGTLGYVKYVTDKVQDAELRAALAAHGELTYFDINRQKNCAFIEYKTVEGIQAAVAANPHVLSGENIIVEPRRPKGPGYGPGYGSGRGGASGRGRGGFDGRPGGQGPRPGFAGQGRGRGGAPRGRGGAQASA